MNIIKKIFKILLIFISIILIFVVLLFSQMIFTLMSNGMLFLGGDDVIYENWNIRLPQSGKEIYYITGEPSFHGDGPRFSVYEYDDEEIIDSSFDWKDKKNTNVEDEINNILKILDEYNDVPKEYIPNLEKSYKYLTNSKEDGSDIYLIYVTGENRIYVIEYLL